MKLLIPLILISIFSLSSCKKAHTCTCFNPGGIIEEFPIRDSEKNASQKCSDYGQKYQTIPMSETACILDME
jgi:hypothetical protein